MDLALSGNAYKNISVVSNDGDARVLLSYIWTKTNRTGTRSNVYIADFNGSDALCIDELYGRTIYKTIIYYYDGAACELFFESGLEFSTEDTTLYEITIKCQTGENVRNVFFPVPYTDTKHYM